MNEECISCEWYNKPYWSIISPCANCTKRFNKKSVTVTHYSINIDKKELYKEIEQLQQEKHELQNNWNELKGWLKKEHREDAIVINLTWKHATGKILNKMNELEGKSEEDESSIR